MSRFNRRTPLNRLSGNYVSNPAPVTITSAGPGDYSSAGLKNLAIPFAMTNIVLQGGGGAGGGIADGPNGGGGGGGGAVLVQIKYDIAGFSVPYVCGGGVGNSPGTNSSMVGLGLSAFGGRVGSAFGSVGAGGTTIAPSIAIRQSGANGSVPGGGGAGGSSLNPSISPFGTGGSGGQGGSQQAWTPPYPGESGYVKFTIKKNS